MSLLRIGQGQAIQVSKPITIPDQIGCLFFATVHSPFEVESLKRSIYKIGIFDAMTRFLWTNKVSSNKVDGVLEQWLKDTISWMRVQGGLKGSKFQTDNGPSSSFRRQTDF